ncbi:MAG: NADH-quinone oxidoreductase subunit G [Syntrophorhabdaceae bacterium PtaU1.Bin034]|nr:MAG: NADH-quinone oxidoreductase subunit G [Syntrophorhabdaceae bacterium PtaU1.Bin034]
MATIYIDKKPYEVKEGDNLLHACLGLGFDLPYFCWHPALHSVGACRQCAIKHFRDDRDTKGRIVMACMTPVKEGMHISIDDPEARKFRAGVIEWLMTNHPHDCPVCDEGGECHLQDMTVMTGHSYRRFRFRKRTHRNQDLGPFVTHEMNRCIACYRCTRFYNDYARGRDFGVFACHNDVYFGRAESGTLESEFAGNLVEICPTGVFTDKTLVQHYTRKWDLQTAPSVCVHCSLGCNTIPGERYGSLRRIRNRYNGRVNGYFLCDRGRYGYEFVNSDRRIHEPRMRKDRSSGLESAKREDVVEHLSDLLASSRGIIGIGSPRASLEANFALSTLVGADRFYSGVPRKEQELVVAAIDIIKGTPASIPSLAQVAVCDAVLVLGEDISNTAPVLSLNVLQSVRQKPLEAAGAAGIPYWDDTAVRVATGQQRGPLFVVTTGNTGLDGHATEARRLTPSDIARTGFAIAHEIDPDAPPVEDLRQSTRLLVEKIVRDLKEAKRPLVISGVNCGSKAVLEAASNIAGALSRTGRESYLCLVMPECNSFGLGLMPAKPLDEALHVAAEGKADLAIILENDLYRRADQVDVHEFLRAVRTVVVMDHLFHATSLWADMLLPATTFAESEGTLVNNEGRAQRFFRVFPGRGEVQESWRWMRDIMKEGGRPEVRRWHSLDQVNASMARSLPVFEPASRAAPSAAFRIAGLKVAREHQRYSGRTAMHADKTVHEPKPLDDIDSALTFSMEGFGGAPPAPLIPRFWAPGWNSDQSVNKFQAEIGGALHGGDPGERLLEPLRTGQLGYFTGIPEAFASQNGLLLIVPFYHIFGSDELSMLAPGIADRAPEPYLALSPADMDRLRVKDGDVVGLHAESQIHRFRVKSAPDLPPHVGGLPYGLPRCPVLALPAWAKVDRTP